MMFGGRPPRGGGPGGPGDFGGGPGGPGGFGGGFFGRRGGWGAPPPPPPPRFHRHGGCLGCLLPVLVLTGLLALVLVLILH